MRTVLTLVATLLTAGACSAPTPEVIQAPPADVAEAPTPRMQPGGGITMYAPEQHELYDGHFVISGGRIQMVGSLDDAEGWDHMDNSATTVHAVDGTIEIDVDEIANTGTVEARLRLPEGDFVLTFDRFHEFSACQNGGVAAYLYEHGADSGCGDMNWPKTFGYLAGWGYGHATLNGKPLYQDYEVHFMVTQGVRDRETLRASYPPPREGAGAVNPATQQIDFYIRSPEMNANNTPGRQVFAHFFAMETTWR